MVEAVVRAAAEVAPEVERVAPAAVRVAQAAALAAREEPSR